MVGTRAGFLSAVPLSTHSREATARRNRASPRSPGGARFPSRLGQGLLPGLDLTGVGGITGGVTEFGLDPRCYRCGLNPPTLMLPSTASFNPSCVEVESSLCAGQSTEPVAGGGTSGLPGVPTTASLTVFEPTELGPLAGAQVKVIQIPLEGSPPQEVASGVTGADGRYELVADLRQYPYPQAPHVGAVGNLRFVVTPGPGSPSFPETTTEVRGMGLDTPPSFTVACVSGTPSVICEVARGQAMWSTVYEQQLLAWNYYTSGRPPQIASFAADQAHTAVMNGLRPKDSHLQGGVWIQTYSWWIGDLGIPPKDWPDLLEWSTQAMRIFSAIPFPTWEIKDYFVRCARGIPFAMAAGKEGENFNVANPRLYSKTYSNYFPNTDEQIEKDMAAAYSDGLQAIIKCIIHKIKQKQKELERTARAMSLVSLSIVVAFSPFLVAAGPSGVAVLATEAYEFVKMQQEGAGIESYGVTAALAAAMLAVGNAGFVVAALEPVLGELMTDMDPMAAQAVNAALPQIVESAVDAVAGPLGIGSGVEAGGGAIGGAAVAMAIKVIAGIAKNYAAKRIEEFQDVAAGAQQAAADVMAFAEGKEASPQFKPFVQWVVETLDLMRIFNDAIDQFLDEFANALDQGVDQGGGVTVVDSDDGGGPVVLPTDPDGTPTNDQGDPIPPGGVASPLPDPAPDKTVSTKVAPIAAGVGAGALILVAAGAL